MRPSLLYVFLVCVAGCTSGCSTGAQIEGARMINANKEKGDQVSACLGEVYSKPDYAHLETKLYLKGFQFPLQYLTDPSKPNKPEITDLYKLYNELQSCRKMALDGAATVHPLLVAALVDYYSEEDRSWIDAVKGNLTWGNFNEARRSAMNQFQDRTTQANMQVGAQLQNQHQFELQQRQQAVAAMQQWAYQQKQFYQNQQAINALNRPRTINCNYYGDTATCNSN